MTVEANTLATIDGFSLLYVVLFIDFLILIFLWWWNRKYSLKPSPAWWSPKPRHCGISDSRYQLILWAILAVAVALRSLSLNSGLWIDEVLTLVQYVRPDLTAILSDFSDDNQHILYSALAHISVTLFGESPAALRLPAMLAGVGSIWATAHLVRYVFGKKEALFSAALLTLSYHHVWFSQNARAYTLLLLGTVISTELLLRGLASGKGRYWLAYAAVIALTAWAHLTAIFVALAHGVILLFMGMAYLRSSHSKIWQWRPFLALGLAAWLTVNLYAPVIPQLYKYFSRSEVANTTAVVSSTDTASWSNPVWLVNEILNHLMTGLGLGWLGVVVIALLGLYGLIHVLRRDWLFTLLALAPALITGLVFLLLGRNLWPRMFFQEIGVFAAIAVVGALGAGQLLTRIIRPWPRLIQTVPVLLLCVLFAVSLPRVYRYPKQDFSGARDYVKAHLQPGDTVLGLHMAGRVYHLYYEPDWLEINDLEGLNEQEAHKGYTWILYTLPAFIRRAHPEIQHKLDTEYEIMQKFPGTLGDGKIMVLRSRKQAVGE